MGDLNLDFKMTDSLAKETVDRPEEGQLEEPQDLSQPDVELDSGIEDPLDTSEIQEQEPDLEASEAEVDELAEFETVTETEPTGEEEKKYTEKEFLKLMEYKADGEMFTPESLEDARSTLSKGRHMTRDSMAKADRERQLEQQLQTYQNQLFQMQQAQQQAPRQVEQPKLIQITEDMLDSEKALAEHANKETLARAALEQRFGQMEGQLGAQASNANNARLHSEYEYLRNDYGLPGKGEELHDETRDNIMAVLWANQQVRGVNPYTGAPNYGLTDAIEDVMKVTKSSQPDWENFDYEKFYEKDKPAAQKMGKSFLLWYQNKKKEQKAQFKSPPKAAQTAPPEEGEEEKVVVPIDGTFNGMLAGIESKLKTSKILSNL